MNVQYNTEGEIELPTRHRLELPGGVGNTYLNVNNQQESGSTALHEELDLYFEEKGIDFDIGTVETIRLCDLKVPIPDNVETLPVETIRFQDARVWLLNIPYKMLMEVIFPGINLIAKNHKCHVTELGRHFTPTICSWQGEVRH